MVKYLIAYKDKYGKDYCGHPWILDFEQEKESAVFEMNSLREKQFQDVTLFSAIEEEIKGIITWEFVNKHKIEE